MSTLRAPESTLPSGNRELSNPLPKAKATAKFSTLCCLDAAHRATGQLPMQCNLNTLEDLWVAGINTQPAFPFFSILQCLLINGNIYAARIILLARDTDLCQTALPSSACCSCSQGRRDGFSTPKLEKAGSELCTCLQNLII